MTTHGHDFPELDRMRAYSDELRDQVQKVFEQGDEIRQQMAEIKATAYSEDRTVQVTADVRGQVIDLKLDPEIYRRPNSRELAETILETIQAAVTEASTKATDIASTVVPREAIERQQAGDFNAILESMSSRIFGRE